MRTIARLLAAGLATTALVAASATPASAQSQRIKDKRADVVRYEARDDDNGDKATVLDRKASVATGLDATQSTIKHSKKSLTVTIKFSKLTKHRVYVHTYIRFKGAKNQAQFIVLNHGSNKKVSIYDRALEHTFCTAKLKRKTGKSGSISFKIKRKCLDSPKAIKATTSLMTYPDGRVGDTYLSESISSSHVTRASWSKWLKSS